MKKSILFTITALVIRFSLSAQQTALIGTTFYGGNGNGTIFTINTGGTTINNLHNFTGGSNAYIPESGLSLAPNGKFYGVVPNGCANGYGGIYEITEDGTYNLKYSFTGSTDGGNPKAALCLGSDNVFYGTTTYGGSSYGTLFSYTPGSSSVTPLVNFGVGNGTNPNTSMINASNNILYGTTASGGANGNGVIYSYDYSLNVFTVIHNFFGPDDGTNPTEFFEASDGLLYALTGANGPNGFGCIFSYDKVLDVFNIEYPFTSGESSSPFCGFAEGTPGNLYAVSSAGGTNGYGNIFQFDIINNTYTNMYNFTNALDGSSPQGALVYSSSTNKFYGTTYSGGSLNDGVIFEFNPSGPTFTVLSEFTGPNGQGPKRVTMLEYTPLQADSTVVNATCNGLCNGSATVNGIGGTGPYSYFWTAPISTSGASASGLCAGTYTCNITDGNGVVYAAIVTISEPSGLLGSDSGTEVTCNGGSDGTATTNPTGGTPPYSYLWSIIGQTTQTATGLTAGSYTVLITDANGCIINDYHNVGEPSQITLSLSQTQTGCIGAMGNEANVFASGGTPGYFYSWSTGGTTDTEDSLDAISVNVTVTDMNGCTTNDMIMLADNPNTDLNGNITAPTLSINDGFVYAFKYQPSINGIDTVAVTPIVSAPNSYTFVGLPHGDYLIKVVPNDVSFPSAVPTYYYNEFQWDSAQVVTHGCIANDAADIDVLEVNAGTGTGFISGYVIEGNGFDGLRLFDGNQPNIPFVPGGPLKGIDIKLGKNPGGGIQARVMSDSTGYYEFTGVPDGDYTIYVDIPNLPMDSTRNVVVDAGSGNILFTQNNYYADSINIFVLDSAVAVGIHPATIKYENKLNIYPNPSYGILHVDFEMNGTKEALIYITNTLGQTILETKTNSENNIINVEQYKAGVYFLNISYENKTATQRMVITNK